MALKTRAFTPKSGHVDTYALAFAEQSERWDLPCKDEAVGLLPTAIVVKRKQWPPPLLSATR